VEKSGENCELQIEWLNKIKKRYVVYLSILGINRTVFINYNQNSILLYYFQRFLNFKWKYHSFYVGSNK